MKTIRYDLIRTILTVDWSNRFGIYSGCAIDSIETADSMVFLPFEVKEEALMELESHPSDITKEGSNLIVTEYFVQENEYDETGTLCGGGSILDYSQIEIELIDKDTREILAVYGNWKAAEEALELYDGKQNVMMSY